MLPFGRRAPFALVVSLVWLRAGALVAQSPDAAVADTPIEVTVVRKPTAKQKLVESAEAVTVVDARKGRERTADMGSVLARTQGVVVRRDGGLGSTTRFSLNGLEGEAIRFFLDGVPLEIAGYPMGIANVPINLVRSVEIYRGVVPIRFGADALGGAVNLASGHKYETYAGASYQVSSFGTQRATLDGLYRHEPSGFVLGAGAFFDTTDNDYKVDVTIPDERGRPQPARVRRFHDGYRAGGGFVETGVVDKPWAKRLLLKGFGSTYDKELQHNVVMGTPYGEVTYGETSYGVTGRYEVGPSDAWSIELVGSYAQREMYFEDTSRWVYDWRGRRIKERKVPGEIEARARDQVLWQHDVFARGVAAWNISHEHSVRLSVTSKYATRTGDERLQADPTARDPLTAQRDLFSLVAGLEYELNLFDGRLQNIVFAKDYVYLAKSEEPLAYGAFKKRESKSHTQGAGDALRFRLTPWLLAKASYEYATRLPSPYEIFGNGILIQPNLELEPEVSHNANVGPQLEIKRTPLGDFAGELNGFLRKSDRMIVLLGNDRYFTYQNVYESRSVGVEGQVGWVSPGRYGSLLGNLTYQDVRNVSDKGTFGMFNGDRVPNRPYLTASWEAALRFANLPGTNDALEPYYYGRYVAEFYRSWESLGLRDFKQKVDAQLTHSLGISWRTSRDFGRLSATFEVDNVASAKVFDNFGVQRPGRSYGLKVTGEI